MSSNVLRLNDVEVELVSQLVNDRLVIIEDSYQSEQLDKLSYQMQKSYLLRIQKKINNLID